MNDITLITLNFPVFLELSLLAISLLNWLRFVIWQKYLTTLKLSRDEQSKRKLNQTDEM